MDFYNSDQDRLQWEKFHSPQFVKNQLQVKNTMQADIIKAIDELAEVSDSNLQRIKLLEEAIDKSSSEDNIRFYKEGIAKYENLTVLAKMVSEIYLMLLDVYTYGTYAMLVKDEWDWRAFARHVYTILYEHSNTVNRQLNEIVKILKSNIDEDYDLSAVVKAKKDFSSFISEKSGFAKQIRIKVDAHFDGVFEERLNLIQNLSYSSILDLYHAYNSKMHAFLLELKPVLVKLRLSADVRCHSRIFLK